jgi:PhoH-like ATPase
VTKLLRAKELTNDMSDDDLVRPASTESSQHEKPSQLPTRVVLDTSVLIADTNCLLAYPDCDIVIPLTVIEELDGLKSRPDDVGRAARAALRGLEDIRKKAGGSLAHPVRIHAEGAEGSNNATVHIEINGIQKHLLNEHGLDANKADNRIIGAALGQANHAPTHMVSNDAALRLKAAHLGLTAHEHQLVGRQSSSRPLGWITVDASSELVDELYDGRSIDVAEVAPTGSLAENSFAILRAGSQSAMARCIDDALNLIPQASPEAWGLRSRSKEQRFAL